MASSSSPATLLLLLFLFFHIGLCLSPSSSSSDSNTKFLRRKSLAGSGNEVESKIFKKKMVLDVKNNTKPLKTKKSNSSDAAAAAKIKLPKLDKTITAKPKPSNSTKQPKSPKPSSSAINPTKTQLKNSMDFAYNPTKQPKSPKPSSSAINPTKTQLKNSMDSASKPAKSSKKALLKPTDTPEPRPKKAADRNPKPSNSSSEKAGDHPAWLEEPDGEGLVSEFRDLPGRLHEALLPDLERLSTTSKAYLSAANAGIAEQVRPFLGNKYAPAIALLASAVFLVIPLVLLTALVRRLGAYLPLLRRLLLLIQVYFAIYFATLALAAVATGLEPLRFFHAASPAAYGWTQAVQSLGYVVYLVLQLVDLVASTGGGDGGEPGRALGLAQMVVGLAVGLHYYATVFHRAAAGEAPRANWRVHGVYAAGFLVICACARAERRKKAYVGLEGAAEWKKR